jgi:aromatic-L-amino-acid/L-tryptophan decarboxylase
MRPEGLEQAILTERASGRRPFLVVTSAGSTPVGAVDDLQAIAEVCERQRVWLHVDAAYGGFFALTDAGRATLRGIERADSVALDPHKGMFLPYGTGCLVVKQREQLRRAHAVEASYLPTPSDDPLAWDFADLGPELSRPFRGLAVWLPLVLHGFAAFREQLDEKLVLAREAADAIRALPDVRMVAEPALSLFAFRAEPPGLSAAETDALNRRWMNAVNQRRRVFVTGTMVPENGVDIFVIRVCILSFRTHVDRIRMLVEDLAETR